MVHYSMRRDDDGERAARPTILETAGVEQYLESPGGVR
jgi:hypothetical protein